MPSRDLPSTKKILPLGPWAFWWLLLNVSPLQHLRWIDQGEHGRSWVRFTSILVFHCVNTCTWTHRYFLYTRGWDSQTQPAIRRHHQDYGYQKDVQWTWRAAKFGLNTSKSMVCSRAGAGSSAYRLTSNSLDAFNELWSLYRNCEASMEKLSIAVWTISSFIQTF